MSLAISGRNVQPYFKGSAVTEDGTPYYKTHKGTVTGAILAVPAVGVQLLPRLYNLDKLKDYIEKNAEGMDAEAKKYLMDQYNAIKETLDHSKKLAIPFAIVAGAITLGCGILYDKIRNDNSKKAADAFTKGNFSDIENGYVGTSINGAPYYKSDNGTRYGALAGMACGLASSIMNMVSNKKVMIGSTILGTGLFTLGGLIVGSIVQSAANKAAEGHSYNA